MNIYKKIIIIPSILAIGLILSLIYYKYNPNSEGNYFPRCIFFVLTGYQCPSCGAQRAIHSLLHLDIAKAFSYNPLLVISIPYLIVISFLKHKIKANNKQIIWKIRNFLMGKFALYTIFVIIMVFWILRNL